MYSELIKIKEARNQKDAGRNRMGCSENWYDPYYAISQTFNDEELDRMSEKELDNLIKLADSMSDALY